MLQILLKLLRPSHAVFTYLKAVMEILEQYVKSSKLTIQATERRKLVFLVCLFLLLTLNKYGNIFVIKKTVSWFAAKINWLMSIHLEHWPKIMKVLIESLSYDKSLNSKRKPHKMVKNTQKICRLLPANCFNVFDDYVGLAPKKYLPKSFLGEY